MTMIVELLNNNTPETLLINQDVWQQELECIPLCHEIAVAFQQNTSTTRVVLDKISSDICAEFFPILLNAGKKIHLQNLSPTALDIIYGIYEKHPNHVVVTCSDELWNSKFVELSKKKKPLLEVKSSLLSQSLLSPESSQLKPKCEITPTTDMELELRRKIDKKLSDALDLTTKGFQLREDNNDDGLKHIYDAFALYDEVIQTNISSFQADAYQEKGWSLCQLGQYRDAIRNFENGVRLQPSNMSQITDLATAYASNKQFQKGIDLLNEKALLFPDNVELMLTRGWILAGVGMLELAKREMGKIIQKIPFRPFIMVLGEKIRNEDFYEYVALFTEDDLTECCVFYQACEEMVELKDKLNDSTEIEVYQTMAELFKERVLALGGELQSTVAIDTVDNVADEKQQPVLFRKARAKSMDDIAISARHLGRFDMWAEKKMGSDEGNRRADMQLSSQTPVKSSLRNCRSNSIS